MTIHTPDFFRDENPGLFRSNPLEVIRATTLANAGNPYTDSNDRIGAERVVFYNDTTGTAGHNETRLVLRMVEHSGGAWNKAAALGTQGGATQGRLLHSNGEMEATGAATVDTIAGALFANYYDLLQNRLQDSRVVTAQQNGDRYWVVVEGMIELRAGTDTIDNHVPIITADDAEGMRLAMAPVITSRLARFLTGFKNAAAVEWRRPSLMVTCLVPQPSWSSPLKSSRKGSCRDLAASRSAVVIGLMRT